MKLLLVLWLNSHFMRKFSWWTEEALHRLRRLVFLRKQLALLPPNHILSFREVGSLKEERWTELTSGDSDELQMEKFGNLQMTWELSEVIGASSLDGGCSSKHGFGGRSLGRNICSFKYSVISVAFYTVSGTWAVEEGKREICLNTSSSHGLNRDWLCGCCTNVAFALKS